MGTFSSNRIDDDGDASTGMPEGGNVVEVSTGTVSSRTGSSARSGPQRVSPPTRRRPLDGTHLLR